MSASGNILIWTTLAMPLCHSEIGLSGTGTVIVVFDAADDVGNGVCPLMGMA